MYVCVSVCVCVCVCVCVFIYIYTYMHAFVCFGQVLYSSFIYIIQSDISYIVTESYIYSFLWTLITGCDEKRLIYIYIYI